MHGRVLRSSSIVTPLRACHAAPASSRWSTPRRSPISSPAWDPPSAAIGRCFHRPLPGPAGLRGRARPWPRHLSGRPRL